ncbi:MAG: ABC transporter ATP-binding protein [Sphingomonadales bacterium]|jgi:lipoprotein-releasing system ATP-binding protein
MVASSLISARNIRKSYGKLEVLKGIDLEIKASEIVCITGESGAGKSTLLHILGTLDKPDAGELFIKDQQVNSLESNRLSKFRNQNLGFVFQFHQLLPEFSALENACMPSWISGIGKKEAIEKAMPLFNMLGIADRVHHKPNELSGGEQQRVSVVRALINNPAVVFADEPSGNLDSKNARSLHDYFLRLRDELGQTFVIVTHNPELADLADRHLQMRDGLFIAD